MNVGSYSALDTSNNLMNSKVKDYDSIKAKEENKQLDKIGSPKLSKEAISYYGKLKEKYKDMDFILVSDDMKDKVMNSSTNYAKGDRTVVLVDEKTIEKMATDESFKKKQEGLIDNARDNILKLKKEIDKGELKNHVTGFGVHIGINGEMSIFAVMEKHNKENKTTTVKNTKKDNKTNELANKKNPSIKKNENNKVPETKLIEAKSFNELLKQLQDELALIKADNMLTKEEKNIGQNIDFKG